ncbi:hypothetical protein LUZ63_001290 [Rhynchospora breviuscula]|uniref:NADP-dependent oxidoreductase domain-containing protein n=1 Tax=Rhynchospora breviuscula TaxID=2022672 RepID=A0A9Q0CWK0_9POAL|nr:hypothetical protein LUZ63_001290 [Rhynchospora breviuscula]
MAGPATTPYVTLNSGHNMPVLGLGTFALCQPPDLVSVFVQAIKLGYRHFDTSPVYGSERPLGFAIAEAIRRGLIQSRDEVFITSKLWCTDADPELVLPALQNSLSDLGLEYLDLYLVHWPIRVNSGEYKVMYGKEDLLPIDMRGVWKAMEECHSLGLVRSIGVSNLSTKKLSDLLSYCTIPPAVNQVEMSVTWSQPKLTELCKKHGIYITAWGPLGTYGEIWGSNLIMENPTLEYIASIRGKTVAQVALRWLYKQKVTMIVKSFNKERMKENLQIFDWKLTKEEVKLIAKIPQQRRYQGNEFMSPSGPYKTIDELWDGEI